MASPLQAQILSAINSIRPYLYGSGLSVLILKQNGVDRQFDPLISLLTDYIVSVDRSGNLTLRLGTDAFDSQMREATHMVFEGWLYQFTEPAKPTQGPFPMWSATGRPLGSRYVAEP